MLAIAGFELMSIHEFAVLMEWADKAGVHMPLTESLVEGDREGGNGLLYAPLGDVVD